ncbi:MAG TPA: hypothetical protein VHG08_00850 [Longimicrobium sp.]|nr:hypothetical protein [Longimicrobium sp.]
MTPPAVSAPPQPSAATRAAVPAPAPVPRARAPLSRPRPPRPGLLTGRTLAVSLAVHLVFLLLVLLVPAPEPQVAVDSGDENPAPEQYVEYLDVSEWGAMATDVPDAPPATAIGAGPAVSAAAVDSILRALPTGAFPDRVPAGIPPAPAGPVAQPGAAPGAGGAAAGQPGAAGQGRTGIGRLGPELRDPRLVVRPSAVEETPLSDEERYQRHFESRIQRYNDSIAGVEEGRRRRNDWTITDRNGRKWGINERGPVLGGRNVPIPVPVPNARPSREQEDAARRERDQRREIDRQAEDIERDRYLRERGKATRERNDRDRQQGQQSGDPPPNP